MAEQCWLMSTFVNQCDKYKILLVLNLKKSVQKAFLQLVYEKHKKSHLSGCIENCVNGEKIHIELFSPLFPTFSHTKCFKLLRRWGGKCIFFITYKSWVLRYKNWLIECFTCLLQISKKYFQLKKVLNNGHLLIIQGKSILY